MNSDQREGQADPRGEDKSAGSMVMQTLLWQISEQHRSIDNIDSKAHALLSGGLTLAVLYGAGAALAVQESHTVTALAASIGGLLVAVPLLLLLAAHRRITTPRSDWRRGPEAHATVDAGQSMEGSELELWIAEAFATSLTDNEKILTEKATSLRDAGRALTAEGVAAFLGLAATAAGAFVG